jgi:hypothetical protein
MSNVTLRDSSAVDAASSSMLELESDPPRPLVTCGDICAYVVRVRKSTRQCSGHAG